MKTQLKIISSLIFLLLPLSILAFGTQTITISPASHDPVTDANPTVTITAVHSFETDSGVSNPVNAIATRLFYDSSVIRFASFIDFYGKDVALGLSDSVEVSPIVDTDPDTDRFVAGGWFNDLDGLTTLSEFTGDCVSVSGGFQSFGPVSGATSDARLAACVLLGGTQILGGAGGDPVPIITPFDLYELKFTWIDPTTVQTDVNIAINAYSNTRGFRYPVGVPSYTIRRQQYRTVAEDVAIGGNIDIPLTTKGTLTGFAITAGNTDTDFAIDSNGQITNLNPLDYEIPSRRTYELEIEISRENAKTHTAMVTITVTDVPEIEIADQTREIAETAIIGANVGAPLATTGGPDEFLIVAGNDSGDFAIGNDGQITTVNALDLTVATSYTLTVEIRKSGSASKTATVAITVTDVPTIISGQTRSISESANVGDTVGAVLMTSGGPDTFVIISGDTNGDFAISSSGQITVAKALDFETEPNNYDLRIEVSLSGGETSNEVVVINVTNELEDTISIVAQTREIAEDASIGANVGDVLEAGGGPDGFTITAGNTNTDFAINSNGQITVAKALNFLTKPSYSLMVAISKDDAASKTTVITINIENVNQAPTGLPTISGAAIQGNTLSVNTASIRDGDSSGALTFTYQWKANDADIATGPTYVLTLDEVGMIITVVVSYTDEGDTYETLTSDSTTAVMATLTGIALAPTYVLELQQGGPTQTVAAFATGGGTASITARKVGGLDTGTVTFAWDTSAGNILSSIDVSGADSAVSFDVSSANIGDYVAKLSVTYTATVNADAVTYDYTLPVRIIDGPIAIDSDKDGITDSDDSDITALTTKAGSGSALYKITSDDPVLIRAGSTVINKSTGTAVVSNAQLTANNLPVDDLPYAIDIQIWAVTPTTAVRIVIPLPEPIPANAVYRKMNANDNWMNFDSATDGAQSALGTAGDCSGVTLWGPLGTAEQGDNCVRITLTDGGDWDRDNQANGRIIDPFGIGVSSSVANAGCVLTTTTNNRFDPTLYLLMLLALIGLSRRYLPITRANAHLNQ